MRVEIIGHFKPCMTDLYLDIDARTADYIHTHPYTTLTLVRHSPRESFRRIFTDSAIYENIPTTDD